MISISLPYYTEEENITYLEMLCKQYSNVVRFSYNRFIERKNQKEIRNLCKSLNNIDLLNSWLIQCGIKEAEGIFKKNGENKVIFGGKKQFYRRVKGLINNQELKEKRLINLMIQGETTKMGNRSFKLDIINNNEIIFKISRNKHVTLKLPNLRNNYKKLLYKLEQQNNIKQGQEGLTYSVRISKNNLQIIFEELKEKIKLLNNRYIGIDMNPNDIGICIMEDEKILETRHYQLNIDNHDKLRYEIFEISKRIEKLIKKWNCKFVFVEDLTIQSKQHGKGKIFNKMINNQWIRKDFINNLEKRINGLGGRLFKVNPAYSSFIGNLMYDFSDPINASIEIARRGYNVIILKNKKFYPDFNSLKDQWKEHFNESIETWKEFFETIKNSGLKYRVPLNENFKVLSHLSKKSNVNYYLYT